MVKTVFVGLILSVNAAHAVPLPAFDNSYDCDGLINAQINNANLPNDAVLTVENGRATVNRKSPRYVKHISDNKNVLVTYKKDVQVDKKVETVQESMEYQVDEQGYKVNNKFDRDFANKVDASKRYGTKVRIVKNSDGTCSLDQASTLVGMPDKTTGEVVTADKKFCDSVKDVLAQMNVKSFGQCQTILDKASEAYQARAQELGKDKKILGSMGSAPANSLATTLQALNSCTPDEWYDKVATPMGTMRLLKPVAFEAAKSTGSNSGSSTQKGVNQ